MLEAEPIDGTYPSQVGHALQNAAVKLGSPESEARKEPNSYHAYAPSQTSWRSVSEVSTWTPRLHTCNGIADQRRWPAQASRASPRRSRLPSHRPARCPDIASSRDRPLAFREPRPPACPRRTCRRGERCAPLCERDPVRGAARVLWRSSGPMGGRAHRLSPRRPASHQWSPTRVPTPCPERRHTPAFDALETHASTASPA